MRILTLAIAGLLSGTAAHAAGDALVIGNSTYNGVQTLFAATQVAEAAEAMRGQGFDVTEARDANGAAMKQGFGDFVATLDDDGGPVVVVLAGAFLHGAAGAYLLPATDGAALADSAIMVEAFPLDAALGVLAKYPGRAFLVLSESAVTADYGDFLEAGLGDMTVPAGVTVLHGPESAVSRFAAGELTKVGQPVVAAAQAAGLAVEGFASADLVVVRPADVPTVPAAQAPAQAEQPVAEVTPEVTPVEEAPATQAEEVAPVVAEEVAPATPAPAAETATAEPEAPAAAEPVAEAAAEPEDAAEEVAEQETIPETTIPLTPEAETAEAEEPVDTRSEVQIAADEAAWRAARISNSEASYQAYLEAQPEGIYANAATQRIKAIKADPFYDLRRAEDYLGLDREARRKIQRELDALGHYHWAVDGIFGDGTRDAVRAWQKADNRDATGYLDLNQIAALERQAGEKQQAAKQEDMRRQQAAAADAKRKREQEAAAAAARRDAEAARRASEASQQAAARPAGPSDAALWAEVERLGSEAAVRRYLSAYPSGARATRAREMLQVIERMRRGG
ncbi:peptidoglycan-binding protein [Sagittula sp. S175]|uniref:peptidoglycan-binding protein n=1 Tax=Sagittula sp. S175 TaxID=3415129 RepID=UPI003C79F008